MLRKFLLRPTLVDERTQQRKFAEHQNKVRFFLFETKAIIDLIVERQRETFALSIQVYKLLDQFFITFQGLRINYSTNIHLCNNLHFWDCFFLFSSVCFHV